MNTGDRARGAAFWVALGVAILLAAVGVGRGSNEGEPLSPRSTSPDGTLALVELLEARDHRVRVLDSSEIADELDGVDVVIVLRDRLDEVNRGDLEAWVRDGHRVLVADVRSPLVPVEVDPFFSATDVGLGSCSIPELADLERLDAPALFSVPTDGAVGSCFTDGVGAGGATVVEWPAGAGQVVAIGGPSLLVNDSLADVDNAAVPVRLVEAAVGDESAVVGIAFDPSFGGGGGSLWALVASPVRWGFAQLGVVALLGVWWQARRFGGVVDEPRLVRLPGSLRVRAAGELRRTVGDHAGASRILGDDLDRLLRRRFRIPADVPRRDLLDALPEGIDVTAAEAHRALGVEVADDAAALTDQLAAIDRIVALADRSAPTRQEVSP